MEQIENIEQLISKANKEETIDKKIEYIMNYIFNTVRYDYAYLFARGYAQGTISQVDSGFRLTESQLNKDEITGVVLSRGIQEGQSRIFNDITQMQNDSKGNYEAFIQNLQVYVNNELKEHLGNDELVQANVDRFMTKIKKDLLQKKLNVSLNGKQYSLNYDVSSILIDYILNANKAFPPIMKNGLLKSGVCDHYSDYLLDLFEKIGIESHKIEGTSELGHAWVVAKGDSDYKSIDLTRAVFIRDGFLGIPKEQTSQDWLCCDIHKIFEMQKTRTITKIDETILPCTITPQNHKETDFSELIGKCTRISGESKKMNSLKDFLEIGLKDGIGQTQCTDAEKIENTKESEVSIDEQ